MQPTDQSSAEPIVARKAAVLVLLGLVFILAGAGSYLPLMGNAFLRNTGASIWALMAVGLVVSGVAFERDRRWWVRAASSANALLVVFSLVAFFWLTTTPVEATFGKLENAPDFSLKDHTGQTVSLAETNAVGPVLLVFYRGHW